MTSERKKEIIERLQDIYSEFEPTKEKPEYSMFELISAYNQKYDNPELIGGTWVRENCPEPLKSLPS